MERKTQVHAENDKQDLLITRTFELPVHLVFKAYAEAELFEQWMGTKVLKLENKDHGSYQFETSDPQGNVVFKANGVIHKVITNQLIIRTFEMENTPFDPQLEFLNFEKLTENTSKLSIQIIYKSIAMRDQLLQLPFAQGINMAHNRLQAIFNSTQP